MNEVETWTSPRGWARDRASCAWPARTLATASRLRAWKSLPSGVSATTRELRRRSFTPSRSSSRVTAFDTAAVETPSSSAALRKLSLSATWKNGTTPANSSIGSITSQMMNQIMNQQLTVRHL
jgi:hypothetical protein